MFYNSLFALCILSLLATYFQHSNDEETMSRIIRLADVYERQVGTQVDEEIYIDDKTYFEELDRVLDDLFEEASDRGLEWKDLADKAGLGTQTVINLGERWTKRPQYRTVCLIAAALDRKLELKAVKGQQRPSLRLAKVG